MTPSLPGDLPRDSGWNVCHDKPEWPSPKLDYYWDHDVQTWVVRLRLLSPEYFGSGEAGGAPGTWPRPNLNPCHPAAQVP